MSIAVNVLNIQAWITRGARYNKLSAVGKSTLSRRHIAGRHSSFSLLNSRTMSALVSKLMSS
jgi:hypothetical protein